MPHWMPTSTPAPAKGACIRTTGTKGSRANLSERETSSPDPEEIDETPWHALSREDVASKLASSDEGLDADEAQSRLERFGANRLPEEDRPGLFTIFLRQFKDPLIYVLLIAGLVSLAIGNMNNAAFIFAVLAINSIIGALQEGRAERRAATGDDPHEDARGARRRTQDGGFSRTRAGRLRPDRGRHRNPCRYSIGFGQGSAGRRIAADRRIDAGRQGCR